MTYHPPLVLWVAALRLDHKWNKASTKMMLERPGEENETETQHTDRQAHQETLGGMASAPDTAADNSLQGGKEEWIEDDAGGRCVM
jgi:hypothetical protein